MRESRSISNRRPAFRFTVDDESQFEDISGSALTGRALLHTVADAILRPRRGQIAIRSLGAGSRVELTVPAARH